MNTIGFLKHYVAAGLVGALIGVGGYASIGAGSSSVLGAADGTWLDELQDLGDQGFGERGKGKAKGKKKAARNQRVPNPNINLPAAPDIGGAIDRNAVDEIRRQVAALVDETILDKYDAEECARNFIRGEDYTAVVGVVRKASLKPMPFVDEDRWTCTVNILPKGCDRTYEAYATSAFEAGEVDTYCNAAFVAAAQGAKVVMITRQLIDNPTNHSPRIVEFNAYAAAPYGYDLDRAREAPRHLFK